MRSARLGFRAWSEEDLALALELWSDDAVTRWIGGPWSEQQVRARLAEEIRTGSTWGVQYWPVFLLNGGAHVGCCGLRPYRPEDGTLELGIHLRSCFWGQGFAGEAAEVVMDRAFANGARALFAGHNPHNESSRRLISRLGFRYTHDEFYPPTGLSHPSYLLTAEDYLARRLSDGQPSRVTTTRQS